MADDLDTRAAQDRSHININEVQEVLYWTERFGVSEADLRRAVADVGVSVDAIALHLGQK